MKAPDRPLCVDLDGTLLRTDMLQETLVGRLARSPLDVFRLLTQLARGRAAFKQSAAEGCTFDPATLPYDAAVVELLRRERAAGRRLVLATASDRSVAERIAGHLGLFDEVLASDGARNLRGEAKARALVERYGEAGFDYVGDSAVDLPVWSRAHGRLLAGGSPGLERRIAALGSPVQRIATSRARPGAIARALRLHQWPKNLLVLVPLLTAHRMDAAALLAGTLAFIAFSLAASAVYLLNDLADLEFDRAHPTKRLRPLASGELGIVTGLVLCVALLAAAAFVALHLPTTFALDLGLYVVLTTLYSLALKRVALVDVMVLAGLYTLRIVAGAAAIEVPTSGWLLVFSGFIFASLAMAKRHVELASHPAAAGTRVAGRGYLRADRIWIGTAGLVTGLMSVLVFALYAASPDVLPLYGRPALLFLACPVLFFWICRVWLLAHRRELHEDPLQFALRDPASYAVLAAMVAIVAVAM